jgi:hypothetical protein
VEQDCELTRDGDDRTPLCILATRH